MPTSKICDVEPFRYQATPQIGDSNASTGQINDQFLEDYLNRLREAICDDIQSIIAECCNGGPTPPGGVSTFLELTDTPAAYAGSGGDVVSVNAGATALEFTTPSSAPDSDGLALNFSTSEQATNRTWIGGKTIYQKTVDCGALPNAAVKDVLHGIVTLERVISFVGVSRNPTTGQQLNLPHLAIASSSFYVAMLINTGGTQIRLQTGTNYTAFTQTYVTLFYTKV